jgi:3-phosphoshikimate 1-carboxyvinyltransferase
MNVLINPTKLSGTVLIPPSKSETHRAIIAASLAKGKSVINNAAFCDDTLATMGAMEKIGVKFIRNNQQLLVNGVGRVFFSDDNFIECNESGSTLRFVLPLFSLSRQKVVFIGKPGLFRRPMTVFENMFKQMGLSFVMNEKNIIMSGCLPPGVYELPGNISSQFISGLFFALPLLKGDSTIQVTTVLESEDYVTMTVSMLKQFGVEILQNQNEFLVRGNQTYSPANLAIEGDFSAMAAFAAAAWLSGDIACRNIRFDETQADRRILDFGIQSGGKFEVTENGYQFHKSSLKGVAVDVSQCPDLAPAFALLGALSEGTTVIENAGRLKFKESNRLLSIYETLKTLGADIEMGENTLVIQGKPMLEGGIIDSFNDHRIVMMGAIASCRCQKPVLIKNSEVVSKSFPDFFADFAKVGGNFTIIEG